MFSISLPPAEKSAFEEKFKFIIVTSHLINPSLSIHHKICDDETQIITPKQEGFLPWTFGISCLFVVERYYSTSKVPIITLLCSGAMGIYYSIRQKHRRSIRQLYQTALSSVQSLIDHSEKLDNLVYQTLVLVKEDELVNQGYRLEMPHSSPLPSTILSQHDNVKLCDKVTSFLRRLFMLYEEAVVTLNQVTDNDQLNTLYDMYNIRLVASLLPPSPTFSANNVDGSDEILNSLTQLTQIMHAKRRECMVTLLSLNMMMDFSVIGSNQIQDWKVVNEVLNILVNGIDQLHDEWEYILHCEQGSRKSTENPFHKGIIN
ncbi:hypothetical protein K501DRAFT_195832 [Backusella circina FSU 941]|nr:hypothetical protein K501DRAFT_195832 [Backusella circina FSU 941]